jgi:drug/metabolite transporter (DMT)-like permease
VTALLAIVSAGLIGAGDFIGGFLARRLPAVRVAAAAQAAGLVLALPVAVAVGWDRVTVMDVVWSLASGLCVGVGLMWFYAAMAGGVVSLVAPAVGVIGAVLPVVVAVARGERPGPLAVGGIIVALIAIAVVSIAPSADTGPAPARTALLALGAGILFGGFFVFYALPSEDAGLLASPLSRITSTLSLALLAVPLSGGVSVDRRSLSWLAAIGVIEVVASVSLLLAFQRGPVAIASVLASLYPVTTVVLAGLVLHERLTRLQRLGVLLTLVAIVLVSLE